MTNPVGAFIWYELMTSDANAASRFYGDVVGWTIAGQPDPKADMDYRMIGRDDGGQAGGVLQLSPEMQQHGARTIWLPYFHAADVDAAIAAMEADGAHVIMPAVDHEVGRFAMLSDPQSVVFYLMKPTPPAGMEGMTSDVFATNTAQHVAWNELAAPTWLPPRRSTPSTATSNSTRRCRWGRWAITASSIRPARTGRSVSARSCSGTTKALPRNG